MKRFILVLLALFIASTASAASFRGTSEALPTPGTPIVQVFDNVSTVDTTFSINPNFLPDQGTMQIVVNGSPTTYDIVIEASLVSRDGPFVPILSLEETDLAMGHFALKAIPYAQVRIEAMTGSGSVDVYIQYRGN